MAGTTVTSAPKAAGVKCPRENDEWEKTHTCNDCEHQPKCLSVVHAALGL